MDRSRCVSIAAAVWFGLLAALTPVSSVRSSEPVAQTPDSESTVSGDDLLKEIAAGIRQNYDRLGDIAVTMETVRVNPRVTKREIHVEVNNGRPAFRYDEPMSVQKYRLLLRGPNFISKPPDDREGITKSRRGEIVTRYVPSSHSARIQTRTDRLAGGEPPDPRDIGCMNSQQTFLEQLANSRVVTADESTEAARPLATVLLEQIEGQLQGMRYRVVFDRSRNCLPATVEYVVNGSPRLRCEIEYQQVNAGAWFPKKATKTWRSSGETFIARIEGDVRIQQDVPETAFEIDLPGGTRVVDARTGREYTVEGPEKPDTDTRVKVGGKLPDFRFAAVDGRTYTPDSLKGKTALIYFIDMPRGMRLDFAEEAWLRFESRGLVVLAIGRDCSQEEMAIIKEGWGLTLPLGGDPDREIYNKFARKGVPRFYVVAPDGTVAKVVDGFYRTVSSLAEAMEKGLEYVASSAKRTPGTGRRQCFFRLKAGLRTPANRRRLG